MGNIDWLFFDMGGTLIDESRQEEAIAQALVAGCARFGLSYTTDDVFTALREGSERYEQPVPYAIGKLARTGEQAAALRAAGRYLPELEVPFPDAAATLEQLARRYRLGIIANQSSGAEERLRGHGLHRYFSVFALSAELGLHKPDPAIFRAALAAAGCDAMHAAYIGDRLDNDIAPAKALGFATVRVLQGVGRYQVPRSPAYQPDYTIGSLGELISLFLP